MNEFTLKLANRGYMVKDFLEYWDISRKTWERMMNNPDKHDKLIKMIEGMKDE